jgi:transposase
MPTPPDSLPDDARALKELLVAAHAENERLIAIIKELQRHRFGPRSEKIDPDQLALMLEDIEQSIAAGKAEADAQGKPEEPPAKTPVPRKRHVNRGALPKHLPREDVVVDLVDKSCPCCNALRVKIGEDVSERLDMIPASFKVIVTRRPIYACRDCEGEVAQAPAPEHLVEGGIPTEGLIAAVVIAKYADHLPLYRQVQIYARQGVDLDRSTLADWSGRAAFALRPVYDRWLEILKGSVKLFADETRAPVLDPGRRKTKIGQFWAYARDDRPWGGPAPPGVVYVYEPDRKHERPAAHLAGFAGILQVDGYGAYKALAMAGLVMLAFCWAHVRRKFFDIQAASPAPIAAEALARIGALYAIERDIQGLSAPARRAARQARAKPILDAMKPWLEAKLATVSGKSTIAEAIRYALSRWEGLTRYLDDGRIEIDNNVVERGMRTVALGRKNHLFAGSDDGATYWAIHASLIETCKMNDVDPQAWLADVLDKIANRHPMSRIDELLPWAYITDDAARQAA